MTHGPVTSSSESMPRSEPRPSDASGDRRTREVRRCARCGQSAVRCIQVTQHTYRGVLPAGRTYDHRCDACGATFQTLSLYRLVRDTFFALLSIPLGLLAVYAGLSRAWWYFAVGGLMIVFGLAWLFWTARALIAQIRNPTTDR